MVPTGYIALHRSIFEHPLFKDEKPWSPFRAWVWLVGEAAWCTTQRKVGITIATLERGQLAATNRGLGKTWGWHESRVRRFLAKLKRQGMIRTLVTEVADAVADSPSASPPRIAVTIITICNYSKFQDRSTRAEGEPTQVPPHKPTRMRQQALDLGDVSQPQPSNQPTKSKLETGFGEKSGEKPDGWWSNGQRNRHGAVSKKRGTIFIKKGTPEWEVYAADYKSVRGAEPFANKASGGFWFKLMGEGTPRVYRDAHKPHFDKDDPNGKSALVADLAARKARRAQ